MQDESGGFVPGQSDVPAIAVPSLEASGLHEALQRMATEAAATEHKSLVLVVDDEPDLVTVTRRILASAGIDSVGCGDGVEALQVLGSRRVDAIISDVAMPHMGGIELLRAVRQVDRDTPVIMVTGGSSIEAAIEAIEQGVYRYLTKPVSPTRLLEVISKALQLRELARIKEETLNELGGNQGVQSDRLGLESVFNNAMDTLWPAFQPIVTADGSLFGYEALLRTDEPSLPNPGAVLDAADRLCQLPRVFSTMRDRSCAAFEAGGHDWTLFLNLHPMDLNDPELLVPESLVCRNAKNIVLEVTERATLDRVPDVRGRIARLRESGYRIAIDDLGAGYAGLTSFASLEPEFVKFDMGLVRDIDKSTVRQRLMRVMSALCHEMGMQVVAEGIETVAERETVLALGCDLLQGYLLGRPGRELKSSGR